MAEEVLKVLYRLHNSGHKAYLVGGAVRDLLLGRTPKDYDVGTDARPDQLKELFVNSRLIGRRFRLAHIVFKGGRVVEVSTFRKSPDPPDLEGPEGEEKDLLIREDNSWGSPQEDAYRRDFTINALFYNIADFSVIDYVGGLADLRARLIRTIGDANIRFREDPVRMVRAVEYAARLGFDLHPDVRRAIHKHRKDLRRASAARIADELLNLLKSGAAEPAFREMWRLGILEILHADLHAALNNGQAERFFKDLAAADARFAKGTPLRDVALLSMLFTPPLRQRVSAAEAAKGGKLSKGEYLVSVEKVVDQATPLYQVPNRRRHQIKQVVLAARKMRRRPSRHRGLSSIVERAYFLDAFDLLQVEVETSGEDEGVLREWSDLKLQAQREGRIIDPEKRTAGRRRRGGRREKGRGERPDERRGRRGERGRGREKRAGRGDDGGRSREERSETRDGGSRSREERGRDRGERERSREERGEGRGDGGRSRGQRREGRDDGGRSREERGRDRGERERSRSGQRERERPPDRGGEHRRSTGRRSAPKRDEDRPRRPAERTVQSPAVAEKPDVDDTGETGVELYTPPPDRDRHGRQRREGRAWKGVAGQRSSTVMSIKEGLESGELKVPPEEEIPYVVPGRSLNETTKDWSANVGRLDELAADTSRPDSEKWGRRKRKSPDNH